MLLRFRPADVILPAFGFFSLAVGAQAPVALPYTMTTIGGLTPMAATAGTQCPNLPAGVTSTDAYGDGCLAVNGIFGDGAYSGVAVDAFGNVLVNDDIKGVLHVINPVSGIMTLVAGGNTACSSKLDSSGDGCVAATGTPTAPVADARGVGIDPYGNILLAGYNDHFVHIVCRSASPLCGSGAPSAANPIQIPVGNMGLVAGCAYATGSSGNTGVGLDNTPAFSISTASASFSGSPFVNAGGSSSACNPSLGEVDQPRGVTGDVYGNIYFADTTSERWRVVLGPQTYNGVTNPLWAVLEQNPSWPTVTAGYAYTIAGITTTGTTAGSTTHCNGNTNDPSPEATDAYGDGCLFTSSSVYASTSDAQGVGADAAGNVVFTDAGHGLLRVLFVNGSGTAGAAMAHAIEVNNAGYGYVGTPQPGFVYMLAGAGAGSGTGSVSTTPRLGYSTTSLSSGITKLTVSPQGNIFIGYGSSTATSNKVLFFDIATGYIRTLFTSQSSNVAAGNYCAGSSGQKSVSAYSDDCPASVSEFGNSNGLSVAVDGQGNLYLYDGSSNSGGELVRKVLAQGFAGQTLLSPLIQTFEAHLLGATSATSTVTNSTDADLSYGSPSCTLNGDDSVDCTVAVTSTPSAAGLRSATLSVSNASSGTSANIGLAASVRGSVLAFDNASTSTNGISTPVAPTSNALFSAITPAAVAVDGAANIYAASGGSLLESIGGTTYTLSTSLASTPSQIAVDPLGDIFIVAPGTSTIEELAVSAAGTPAAYTSVSISYTPCADCTAAPQAIAVDAAGSLYVADYQSSGSTIYRLSLLANATRQQATVATGFENPVSLAADSLGNVYVADKGAGKVYELTPSIVSGLYTYTQSVKLSSVVPVAVAADAAGDLYVQDETSATVIEVPVSGAETSVLTGLQTPAGLAVDGLGNIYSADSHNSSITQVVRDAGSYGSTSVNVTSINGTLTNVGNLSATGIAQAGNSADFTLTPSGCTIGSGNSFASGEACMVSAALSSSVLSNSGDSYTESLSFLAAPTTIGSVTFSDLVPIGPTTTTISGPPSALYAASGTEASFTIAVTGIASPNGSPVSVTVNSVTLSGTTSVYSSTPTLNASGQATVSLSGLPAGAYTISASYAGVTNTYAASSAQVSFSIEQFVATGDTRTVTEPVFPSVCTTLTAALTSVNDDIPASVDATVTNPDGARIQAALASCAGTGQAVELSVDDAGHNAYLTGPLSMPSGVTLLVDPGVYVYFSRNVQDYDRVAGTHTCGTVNSDSATSSCLPLIEIPGTSTNVGIMGFGKLNGRGGDPLINAFPSTYAGQSWWGLSAIANSGGNQQNPRFIQIDTGASNITLYKITLRNSPLFHISTTGAVSNFTAWDIKIVTPTSSRNTDGIDPGNAQNFTITQSWISDGDDNIAVGAANTVSAENISVTHNHFFAGHGESIGSYTTAGVSNILFDSNMSSGNGIAGSGSSINDTADSNSTGIRIKSGYDRGGLVTNIQYSNSCYQDHNAEIVFSPNYENTTGSLSPNLQNILMQNLAFLTAGTAQFTGTSNSGTVYPLQLTLDNVSFPNTFPASEFSTAPSNAELTYGPGQVSADFVSDFATFAASNGNSATNNITETSLNPPTCNFTYIAPELTGPNGLPQTITEGQNATAIVILTPAVGGAPYPTGTVTLTDALTSNSTIVTLPGTTDTIFVPLTGLAPGTHTFTATYSGDSHYTLTAGQSVYSTTEPYVINVNSGNLGSTTTSLSGVPASTPYGTGFTATATVTGSSPTGTVEFIVNGTVFTTAALSSGTATASISLPYSTNPYSIYAVYSGDSANDGSISSASSVTVTPALTTTALSANSTSTTLGHPVALTATVASSVGVPSGSVTFTYTTTGSSTPVPVTATLIASSVPNTAIATAGVELPVGTDSVTATYAASGSFAGSASAPMSISVSAGTILALPANPIPLPYTMTTLAGGAASNCAGATDNYGDGCPAASIVFGGSVDLRSVDADPFGNVYLTDGVASVVRRIAPNGIISNFAGRISGTACVPSATSGCTPTQVSIDKPRGLSSDTLGNIYIAGYDSHEVFKVSVANGLMYLVAGTGTAGNSGDGGPATSAEVNGPRGVWADSVGNVYIADTSNNKIRVVDITGAIHTFAGTGTAASNGDSGPATSAAIDNPQGVMTDANLNVYIADSSGGKIRVVCVTCGTGSPLDALLATLGISSPQNGYIYTIAGGAASSYSGAYPTLATNVTMSPQKLAMDASSNIYISDGNGVIWFIDSYTAEIRPIAGKVTANCSSETDNFGDGCPATQAVIGDGGNGIGVGTDTLGNLYISDTLNARIRKVTTGLASSSTATAATTIQPVDLHFVPGDTPASTNALAYSSPEWSLAAPDCTTNADNTTDCLLASSFTPAVPGARSTPLAVNSALGNTASLALTGIGLGAGSTLDPASQNSFGSNLQITGLATDNAGNVYVADSNSKQLLRFASSAQVQGASAASTSLVTLTAPGPVAVDPRGYVYVGDTSTGLITQVSPAGAVATLPLTFKTPAGLAVDALNNLYVSDSSVPAIYQFNPIAGAVRTLPITALVTPAGLAIDPSGNLLVTDPGAPAIYRFNLQSGVTSTVTSPAVMPSAIATDAAGNLLIADTASILAVPASANSASFTVAGLAPAALAIDSAGNLYTGSSGAVLKLTRTQGYVQFAGASAAPATVNLLESGNQSLALSSVSQTDTADYSLTATASTDCTLNGALPSTLAIGGVCALTATYTPNTFGTTTDTATFNGNLANATLSTPALVQLTLTGAATPPTPTITSVSPIASEQTQTITIAGSGFGFHAAYTGDSNFIALTDITGSWTAGKTGDGVTLAVSSWADSQIVLTGLSGSYGTVHCIHPGDQLSISVWNVQTGNGPAVYPIVASSGTDTCAPAITSVSPIISAQTQTITITGAGFGSQAAYNGDSNFIALTDITGSWTAGKTGDGVTLAVSSWTDTQIVLTGLSGSYGTVHCIHPGDQLSISVWNVQTGNGPAVYPIVASSGTDTCAPAITSVSPIISAQTQTITITGAGFGSQAAYTGDSNFIALTDITGSWTAGKTGDGVTLAVSSWADSQIVLTGLSGSYGTVHCIHPGDQLSISIWNASTGTGPAVYPIVAASGTDNCAPVISSVSAILPQQTQTITINGTGFGSQAAYTGDSNYIEVTDSTRAWSAGYTGDSVILAVSSWTDSQIVLTGLSGNYGPTSHCIAPGDQLSVEVWNAQTGSGPAVYPVVAASGTNTCP